MAAPGITTSDLGSLTVWFYFHISSVLGSIVVLPLLDGLFLFGLSPSASGLRSPEQWYSASILASSLTFDLLFACSLLAVVGRYWVASLTIL